MPLQTCPDCGQDRELVRLNHKSSGRCHRCAEKYVMKFIPKVKHFRLCVDCGDIKETKKGHAGVKRCRECNDKHRVLETASKAAIVDLIKPKVTKPQARTVPTIKKPKKQSRRRTADSRIYDKVQIQKVRDHNKAFFKLQEAEKKKTIPEQKRTDEDMIAEFIAKRKATCTA